jgi:transforming growth factor-beta-induced protein
MTAEMTGEMIGEPFGPACSAVPDRRRGQLRRHGRRPRRHRRQQQPRAVHPRHRRHRSRPRRHPQRRRPFTIFAPTNDAFAAIPAADLEAVLADQDLLTSILTYHVVAGERLSSADLIAAGSVDTVDGGSLTITDDGGTLTIDGVPSVCMDVTTANATVHIIGGVLMPS